MNAALLIPRRSSKFEVIFQPTHLFLIFFIRLLVFGKATAAGIPPLKDGVKDPEPGRNGRAELGNFT
jgi:hypothetical protein